MPGFKTGTASDNAKTTTANTMASGLGTVLTTASTNIMNELSMMASQHQKLTRAFSIPLSFLTPASF